MLITLFYFCLRPPLFQLKLRRFNHILFTCFQSKTNKSEFFLVLKRFGQNPNTVLSNSTLSFLIPRSKLKLRGLLFTTTELIIIATFNNPPHISGRKIGNAAAFLNGGKFTIYKWICLLVIFSIILVNLLICHIFHDFRINH